MSASFHRGLTDALKMRLQLTGLRLEEEDAQHALAGWLVVDAKTGKPIGDSKAIMSDAALWVREAVSQVLADNLRLTREWEERNPGIKPFADMLVEKILRVIAEMDPDNPMETINKIKDMAETELMFG